MQEMRHGNLKREDESAPAGLSEPNAQELWNKMKPETNDSFDSNITLNKETQIRDIFAKNCVLYFPSNRFEEPAWLNEDNLTAKAEYMDVKHIRGQTNREMINLSPLHDNQNWLFEVIYDRAAFEFKTTNLPIATGNSSPSIPVFVGYSGNATSVYDAALQIVQNIVKVKSARFGIGARQNRVVSIQTESELIVPNIFQLSSGETALMNLFLSILRDFDLCGTPFSSTMDIRGIVVVDEIDLHLHTDYQYNVLPVLIRMFPDVQFVITTHSPLFVLGMSEAFGEDGFALYRLPQGQPISPEEFSEFGDAYRSLTTTRRYLDDMRTAIEGTQKPLVYMEGITDQKYLRRASNLLGREALLSKMDLKYADGGPNLSKIWKGVTESFYDLTPQKVVLLHDCDSNSPDGERGNWFTRSIPIQVGHPIKKGIENLFNEETLEKARQHKLAFINSTGGHEKTVGGKAESVPEDWAVNPDEKTNLCNWLCENGTADDFQGFEIVFELLENLLSLVRYSGTSEGPN